MTDDTTTPDVALVTPDDVAGAYRDACVGSSGSYERVADALNARLAARRTTEPAQQPDATTVAVADDVIERAAIKQSEIALAVWNSLKEQGWSDVSVYPVIKALAPRLAAIFGAPAALTAAGMHVRPDAPPVPTRNVIPEAADPRELTWPRHGAVLTTEATDGQ